MGINRANPDNWNRDIESSVSYYNNWFMTYAPPTFRKAREKSVESVKNALSLIKSVTDLDASVLMSSPSLVEVLRQMTCPPLASDRLAGLAQVPPSVIKSFASGKARESTKREYAVKIMDVIAELLDTDLISWIDQDGLPTQRQMELAALVVSDRLCGAMTDPLIRNEQEKRQIRAMENFLESKGYVKAVPKTFKELRPGEYALHLNVKVRAGNGFVKIPGDVSIQPKSAREGSLPILIEAKSAGDFTNVNKRRKEEATKVRQLRATYGEVRFVLFLGGYFDAGYLGYEAAEGIDWIWEHRISDMEKLGL